MAVRPRDRPRSRDRRGFRAAAERHLHSLSITRHTRARGGETLRRVFSDGGRVHDFTVTALLPLIARVLVGMLIVMLLMDARLTLIAVSAAPLFGFTLFRAADGTVLGEFEFYDRIRPGVVVQVKGREDGDGTDFYVANELEDRFRKH